MYSIWKEKKEDKEEIQPFIFININNIDNTSMFNLFLEKYKEIHSYACECRKQNKEDVLCVKIKYNIESYLTFLFLLFDLAENKLFSGFPDFRISIRSFLFVKI